MDFEENSHHQALRSELRDFLNSPEVIEEVRKSGAPGLRPDPRPVFRLLGGKSLLAVGWPERYGGRGMDATAAAIVLDELIAHGVPDTLFVTSVQVAGSLILAFGNETQCGEILPALARGQRLFSILLSEKGCGSDLSRLKMRAHRMADGSYRLDGQKAYSINTDMTDCCLVAARTSESGNLYQQLTLFLIDLTSAGIEIERMPTLCNEKFCTIGFDGVVVGPGAVLGRPGDGWAQITAAISYERTGLDYYGRAKRWFGHALAAGKSRFAGVPESLQGDIGRFGARLEASRLLAWRAVRTGGGNDIDGAMSKFYASELAKQVAWWATDNALWVDNHPAGPCSGASTVLEAAYREAPSLTLSAGASEVMLDTISSSLLRARSEPRTDRNHAA